MPTECFIPKDFRVGTRAIIRKANTLIADYQRQGYKLTRDPDTARDRFDDEDKQED